MLSSIQIRQKNIIINALSTLVILHESGSKQACLLLIFEISKSVISRRESVNHFEVSENRKVKNSLVVGHFH